jgi:hypothetical protein
MERGERTGQRKTNKVTKKQREGSECGTKGDKERRREDR